MKFRFNLCHTDAENEAAPDGAKHRGGLRLGIAGMHVLEAPMAAQGPWSM